MHVDLRQLTSPECQVGLTIDARDTSSNKPERVCVPGTKLSTAAVMAVNYLCHSSSSRRLRNA